MTFLYFVNYLNIIVSHYYPYISQFGSSANWISVQLIGQIEAKQTNIYNDISAFLHSMLLLLITNNSERDSKSFRINQRSGNCLPWTLLHFEFHIFIFLSFYLLILSFRPHISLLSFCLPCSSCWPLPLITFHFSASSLCHVSTSFPHSLCCV